MVFGTFRKYTSRDAGLIQTRIKAFGVGAPSLEELANCLDLRAVEGKRPTIWTEKLLQAGCIAENLEDEGVAPQRASNLAWMVLNIHNETDIPYLMMWKAVRTEGIRVNNEVAQTDAKRAILAEYFIDEFGAGQKQDIGYIAVVNRLKEKDIKAAAKAKKIPVGKVDADTIVMIEDSDWNLRYSAYVGRVFKNVYRGAVKAAKVYELTGKK